MLGQSNWILLASVCLSWQYYLAKSYFENFSLIIFKDKLKASNWDMTLLAWFIGRARVILNGQIFLIKQIPEFMKFVRSFKWHLIKYCQLEYCSSWSKSKMVYSSQSISHFQPLIWESKNSWMMMSLIAVFCVELLQYDPLELK